MKILFYGNCQTQVAMYALMARNPKVECEYAGNSRRVTKFDPGRTERLMDWCDHIITQPVMNASNADHHTVLRARFAGKITFMPYLWVDGLYSLCAAPGGRSLKGGKASIVGEEIVATAIRERGLAQTLTDFKTGALDFDHRNRLESSLAELERREESADVRVAPLVRQLYRDEVVMLTHNHPHPTLVNDIARQIAARLDLAHAPITRDDPLAYSTITLPEFGKVLSPYVVEDLGLRLPYDLQWLKTGRDLIQEIATAIESAPAEEAAAPVQSQPDAKALSPQAAARRAARVAERAAARASERSAGRSA